MAINSEYEHSIRALIQLIVAERDPDALSELASELERLLKLEGTKSTASSSPHPLQSLHRG